MLNGHVFILSGKLISPDALFGFTANSEQEEAPTPAEPSSTR